VTVGEATNHFFPTGPLDTNGVPAQDECHFQERGLFVHNPQLGSQVSHLQRLAANRAIRRGSAGLEISQQRRLVEPKSFVRRRSPGSAFSAPCCQKPACALQMIERTTPPSTRRAAPFVAEEVFRDAAMLLRKASTPSEREVLCLFRVLPFGGNNRSRFGLRNRG
jgi:hypothetical protein